MNYKVPFDFVLRYLYPVRPKVRKMLGCYALVQNNTILMLLRERDNHPEYNGIFVATQPQYYDQLENEIHASNMDANLDGAPHTYLFISEDLSDFDEKVRKACDLIKAGDERIGKDYQ